ncbi:hypothetical protein N7492_006576 [Penicillium capsulatum]|uniref:NAD dependent epimerase/dehydratase n=1 Tax=Penicillium capsulatum TaxID=69766 RepID=A0A9W9HZK9_9EURO|nr:hypothetical protein N7492_006576 [Penicillium capsulatum]KAJ6116411.1 hypothetical protein N7512_006136 [Penicillium capsulatum]
MGQTASTPKPGAEMEVIGAGLPRTGTSSFSAALDVLLDGPTYHGGTQICAGPSIEIKSWIRVLQCWLKGDAASRNTLKAIIRARLDGYSAVTDCPCCQLVPELLEIYPNAKVICTTRDPITWEESMNTLQSTAMKAFLRAALFLVPGMRHFPDYGDALGAQWMRMYAINAGSHGRTTYARHMEWLKANVPEDRLVFFDVKDGWEPLCKALGKDVPKDVPFPRVNDAEALQRVAQYHIRRGIRRWAMVFGALAAVGIAIYARQ